MGAAPLTSALIGHTGFVGSNLLAAEHFDECYNSSNIEDIRGRSFDRVVCAGARAEKWRANNNPIADAENIGRLIENLSHVTAKVATLISTVDTTSDNEGMWPFPVSAYGKHRLWLENELFGRFLDDRVRIVRLPALFGPGLKKNVLFDLMRPTEPIERTHEDPLVFKSVGQSWRDIINPDSRYQWYPVRRLAADLAVIEAADVTTVNLVTEPIATRDIQSRFFSHLPIGERAGPLVSQDVHTKHAALWGKTGPYVLTRDEVFDEMAKFLSTER